MEKKYEVKITRHALAQMQEIVRYISNNLLAPEAADSLMNDIKEAILGLTDLPKRYALIEEEPWRSEGVRKITVKNFLVYYWVDEENKRTQVTAIIYNKRDQLQQLAGMKMK